MANSLTIVDAKDEILRAREDFELVSPEQLSFQKEFQFAMQALERNKTLLKVALENPQSLKNAIVNIGAVGLSLNPAERLAYLVPMDGAVQLQVGYIGFLKLGVADGGISWGHAEVVKEKDIFTFNGVGREPTHVFSPFIDRGKVIGVYCVAKTHDGSFLTRMMSREECIAIRDRSKMWMATKSGPWATDENEMMKKTVIKQGSKTWPKGACARLEKAIEVVNEFEGIDFNREIKNKKISDDTKLLSEKLGQKTVDPKCQEIINSIQSICKTICEGYNDAQKITFLRTKLQINSFKELSNKDSGFLTEMENYLLEEAGKKDVSITVDDIPWEDSQ